MTESSHPKRDFFVSFNRADRAWATWIAWVLEDADYRVFFQDWDFKGNFVLEMDRAHTQSHRTLAVLSPDYLTSRFTAPEWAARFAQDATSERDLLLPVRVRPCKLEGLLAQIIYIDLVDCTEAEALDKLLRRIKGIRKPDKPPEFPGQNSHRAVPQRPEFPRVPDINIHREPIQRDNSANAVSKQEQTTKEILLHTFGSSHYKNLLGRDPELSTIARLLHPESLESGVVIEAMGGMGKTSIAREFCYKECIWTKYHYVLGMQAPKPSVAIRAPDGDYIFKRDDNYAGLSTRKLLVRIATQLKMLDAENLSDSDIQAEVCRRINNHSTLIIIDNLETMIDLQSVLDQIDRLCVPPAQKTLITTRVFPTDRISNLIRFKLAEIGDENACRNIALQHLENSNIRYTGALSGALDRIVEISRGHPLAIEVMSGKLVTQGVDSIMALYEQINSGNRVRLNDQYTNELLTHVFDEEFMSYIGDNGSDLLGVIANAQEGVDIHVLRTAAQEVCGISSSGFAETVRKLLDANCVQRQMFGKLSVLTMHPLTQSYFTENPNAIAS